MGFTFSYANEVSISGVMYPSLTDSPIDSVFFKPALSFQYFFLLIAFSYPGNLRKLGFTNICVTVEKTMGNVWKSDRVAQLQCISSRSSIEKNPV